MDEIKKVVFGFNIFDVFIFILDLIGFGKKMLIILLGLMIFIGGIVFVEFVEMVEFWKFVCCV